jgi:hypothetical protein
MKKWKLFLYIMHHNFKKKAFCLNIFKFSVTIGDTMFSADKNKVNSSPPLNKSLAL